MTVNGTDIKISIIIYTSNIHYSSPFERAYGPFFIISNYFVGFYTQFLENF